MTFEQDNQNRTGHWTSELMGSRFRGRTRMFTLVFGKQTLVSENG